MGLEIRLSDVCKSYKGDSGNEIRVLSGVNFFLENGQFMKLLGASGSGKSTLLNLIAGLYKPDSGEINVGNYGLHTMSESGRDLYRAENVGYVFQTFNLLSPLTVMENISVPQILAGTKKTFGKQELEEVLERFGMLEHKDKHPFRLSVGQRQRVAVARAILTEPELLLADEPTANLDKASADIVREAMFKLKEKGTTLIIATHDPAFDSVSADLVYNVEKGEVAQ